MSRSGTTGLRRAHLPAGRTECDFAIEGGVVEEATKPGVRGNIRIGHFGYGHVDARVKKGDRVKAGQFIGWTTKTPWRPPMNSSLPGRRPAGSTIRYGPAGSSSPTSTRAPIIHDVRFYTPATPAWGRRVTGVA